MHFIYGSAKYPLHVDCYFAFPVLLDCGHFCCEGRFRSQLKNWGWGVGVACGNREVLLTWMGTVPGIHGLVKLVSIL